MRTEPELIGWLRRQIEQDIRVLTGALNQPRRRGLAWLLSMARVWPHGHVAGELREGAEDRLPNRRFLLLLVQLHQHDPHLGCQLCHVAEVRLYPLRVCETLQLVAALYRGRPGYRPEWSAEVEHLMAAVA